MKRQASFSLVATLLLLGACSCGEDGGALVDDDAAVDAHVEDDAGVADAGFDAAVDDASMGCPGSCDDANACTVDTCSGQTCTHVPVAEPASCDDGDECTTVDTCAAGVCTGGSPVQCTALDQCHAVGVCDPATGFCSEPTKPNGDACDDDDACTVTDTCSGGVCTGNDPVLCVPLDACHAAGLCDSDTGACSNPVKVNGDPCSDGDACTQSDACMGGACMGSNPVVCTALDACHDVGACDPGTGLCANPAVPDVGVTCDDGSACTQSDACQGGICVGAAPVVCVALDVCHDAGTCDPGTGVCPDPAKPDGDTCLGTGTCQGGVCDVPDVVLARQDFEVTPATPTWAFAGPVIYNEGFSSAAAAPPNSPLGMGGSRAWETTVNSGGLVLDFASVAVPSGFTRVRLRFHLAAMSLVSSSGGPDGLDYVLVALSVDGGTFYNRVRIRGATADNSFWPYSATGVALVDAEPMIEALFQGTSSGLLADGYATVEVVFPGTVSSIAARITARSSSSTDTWLIDDLELVGETD